MSSWAPKHNMQMPQEGSTDPAYNMYNPNDQQHHFQSNHQPYNQPTPQNWFNQQPPPMIHHNLPPPQIQANNWQPQPNFQHQKVYQNQYNQGMQQYNNYNTPQVTQRPNMVDNSNFQQKDSFENSNDSDPWDWGWEDNSNKKQMTENKSTIQDQIRNQANAIVNSFSTANDDNWNWSFGDQNKSNKNVETPNVGMNHPANLVPMPPIVSSSNLIQNQSQMNLLDSRKLSTSSNVSRNSDLNKPPVNMQQVNIGEIKNQDVNVLSSGVKNMSLQNDESGNKEVVSSQPAPPKPVLPPPPMGGNKPPPSGNAPPPAPPSSISNVSYRRSGQLSHRSANRTTQPQNMMPITPMNAPPSIPDLSGQQNLVQNIETPIFNDAAQNQNFIPVCQPYNPITPSSDVLDESQQNLIQESNPGVSQQILQTVQTPPITSSNQNLLPQNSMNAQLDIGQERAIPGNVVNQNIPVNLHQQSLYINQENQNTNQPIPSVINKPTASVQLQGFSYENQEFKQPSISVPHSVDLIEQPIQQGTIVSQTAQPVNLSGRQPITQTNTFFGNQNQENQQSNRSIQPSMQSSNNPKPPTNQNQAQEFVHMNQENPNLELNIPENSERPDLTFRPIAPVENNENLVSNQERNEYLQTSHLSDSHQEYQDLSDASYIPPGLSRMVPGRPQNGSPTADLDRMIPGQQYDRQIDGQNSTQPGQYYGGIERLIPGSNDNSPDQFNPPPNDERVVTGLEDEQLDIMVSNNEQRDVDMVGSDSPSPTSNVSDRNVSEDVRRSDVLDGADDVDDNGMMTGGREVDMDGENLQDAQRAAEPEKETTGGAVTTSSTANIGISSANTRREESADGVNLQDDNKVAPGQHIAAQSGSNNEPVDKNPPLDGNASGRKQHSRHHEDTTDDSERERRYRSDRRERDRDGGRRERGGGRGDTVTSDKRRYERDRDDRKDYRNHDRDRDRDRDVDYRDRKSHSYRDSDRHRRHRDHHGGRGRYETEDTEDYYSDRDRRNKYREREKDSDIDTGRYQGRDRDGKSSSRRYDRDRREPRDPKDDRRRGDRYDRRSDYEDPYRNISRTGSDRDRRSHQTGYGGFEPFNYYTAQHQQLSSEFYKYYENLRRTNPQAYAEWYHKFYSQGGAGIPVTPSSSVFAMQSGIPLDSNYSRDSIQDDRASVHSGRSSTNDKDRYMNVSLRQQYYSAGNQTGYYGQPPHHHSLMSQSYQRQHSRTQSEFSDSNFRELQIDESSLSLHQHEEGGVFSNPPAKSPERLTPAKFPLVHVKCCLTAVSLLTVMPPENITGAYDVELHNLNELINGDEICNQLTSYPGPLVNGVTHKKTVIEFCEDRVNKMTVEMVSGDACGGVYPESYVLMWELMILLLRQNGRVVGTDIAELLMKHSQTNSKSLRNDLSRTESIISLATSHSQAVGDELEHDEPQTENSENKTQKRPARKTSRNETGKISEKELTDKFREFLIYGNCKDALEWAMSHHLWGHALFLASKLDKRVYANVMTRFANGLPLNDPLQTLYQLMSGRQPAAVTCALDEKWGNWKPHLAMILSNNSERHSELNRKAITTLADTLMCKGDLYAAHFCYLMAQVPFGKYCNRSNEKLVLLGSCHASKRFEEFSNNEAIMLTEVYEYASSLNNSNFIITEFQPFKLLLALRMLDYGLHQKTLLYMERITEAILTDPNQYPAGFLRQVYEWGDKLKFYDPAGRMDDIGEDGNTEIGDGDQQWLRKLKAIVDGSTSNVIEQDSPMMHTEYHNQNQLYTNQYLQPVVTQENQQQPSWQQQQPNYSEQPTFSEQPNYTDQPNSQQQDFNQIGYVDQRNIGQNQNNQYYDNSYQIGQDYQQNPTENAEIQNYHHGQQYQTQTNEGYNQDTVAAEQFQSSNYQSSVQPDSIDQHGVKTQEPEPDYWSQQQQQYQQQSVPQISMPGSSSVKRNFMDSDLTDNSSKETKSEKPSQNKSNAKPTAANNKTSSSNSGWFGGIWNKLSLKPKNQMILPDDKNPTIVWDPEKRKWTNLESEDDGASELKPPPKLSDLMPGANVAQSMSPAPQNISQGPPAAFSTPLGTTHMPGNEIPSAPLVNNDGLLKTTQDNSEHKTPNLQSNMYKLQRNRTLKKSYVDVFNPGGASSPAPLAPLAPLGAPLAAPITAPSGGYFIPAPAPHDQNNANEPGVPTFYDPTKSGYH